jgi:hypothetical protein
MNNIPSAKRAWLIVVCSLMVTVPPALAYAGAFDYFGPGGSMTASQSASTPGYAPRNYNLVYRPLGNQYGLYYYHWSSNSYIEWFNSTSNPFMVGPDSYALAGCQNVEFHAVSPVTCTTTR